MALTTVPASLSATALTLTTAAQPNITSVGTLTGLTVSGNIAGTLTTAAQTNITSVGTLTGLDTTGDITVTKTSARVRAIESGGATTQIAAGSATGYVGTYSNDPLQILSNSTLALTIDTSQNATFEGTLTALNSVTVDPAGGGDAIVALVGAAGAQTLRLDQNSIRTTSNSDINIFTNGNSGQLFLDQSASAVGIFTTTPAGVFNVNSASDTVFTISTTNVTADGRINFRNSAGTDAGRIWYKTNQNRMQFYTNGTEALNIDNTQRIGVGLDAPAHSGLGNIVSVNTGNLIGVGTSGAYVGYNMYFNSGSWKYQVGGAASGLLTFANSGDFSLRQATTGSSAGDTISYSTTFAVQHSTGYLQATSASQVRLTLGSTGTPGTNSANWIRGNSGLLEFNSASSGFNWEVGGNQKMKLNSSGNLAIGAGHDETRRNLGLIGSTPGVHFIDSNVTNLRHEIVGGGNAGLELSADYNNVGTGYIRFDVGGQERARITEAGHIQMQNGGGIDFSATSSGSGASLAGSQEVLDDYEEGTFTPQFHVEGQGAATAAGAYGQYVKVGNVCHVKISSGTLSNIPNPNAYRAWEFRNLPFNSNSYASMITPISVRVTGLASDADYGMQGFLYNNANHGRIEVRTQRSAQNSSLFMNGAECRIQVTYRTA